MGKLTIIVETDTVSSLEMDRIAKELIDPDEWDEAMGQEARVYIVPGDED